MGAKAARGEESAIEAILLEIRAMNGELGAVRMEIVGVNGRLDVMDERLNHIPTKSKMRDYVDTKMRDHVQDMARGEPSQLIRFPVPEPTTQRHHEEEADDIDWPKTLKNAVWTAAVLAGIIGGIVAGVS
jgi:hypothetical protein